VIIIRPPVSQSACEGNFTCAVMFTSGTPSAASWITDHGTTDVIALPGHTRTDDSNGRSAPANVTTVLTVTNVRISDNGADYFCIQGAIARSDTVFLTVFGELSIGTLFKFIYTITNIFICITAYMRSM